MLHCKRNWSDKTFSKCNTEEVAREFNGHNTAPPIIADVELISSVDGVVLRGGVVRREGKERDISIAVTANRKAF